MSTGDKGTGISGKNAGIETRQRILTFVAMYLAKIPRVVQSLFPEYLWRMEADAATGEKTVYLTFDDGPTPEVTDWVLAQLAAYDAQATFFLIGKNVESHPQIAHRVIDSGHVIGNHTYSHRNGWRTDVRSYLKDYLRGQQAIREYTGVNPVLFRPPYGKITRAQARYVRDQHTIVMMDVLTGDFDLALTGEEVYQNAIQHTEPGSVLVFHDSAKAWERIQYALPLVLQTLSEEGYRFAPLPEPTGRVETQTLFSQLKERN
jgi:peptidoglycan/xylan/chitin deacetylase (PgdA/CDA1 family)